MRHNVHWRSGGGLLLGAEGLTFGQDCSEFAARARVSGV